MKAAFIDDAGPPDVIRYDELPMPRLTDSDVLVRVSAVSVNPIDTYIRGGSNYWELPSPFIIGCDLAGVVEDVGPAVTRFQIGDRVWGSNQGLLGRQGTFAECCAVDEKWLYQTPADVSDESAAAVALVGITAHLGLFRDAQIEPSETIMVNGSGAVGSTVIQLARAAGARVFATAGSDQKAAACLESGAEVAVNYRTDDVATALQRFSSRGVDVYWETAREPDFEAIVPLLAERGRIVLMAGRDARPVFPVGPFYLKGCRLFGFVMFKATPQEQRECAAGLNRYLSTGKLKPRIDRVLPLSEAAEAHRIQEQSTLELQGGLCGKLVLKP